MATINLYAKARALAGSATLEIEASTLEEVLSDLGKNFPEMVKLLESCSFLLNGIAIEDRSKALTSQDSIDVLPRFAGG